MRTFLTSAMSVKLAALSLLLVVPVAAQSTKQLEGKNVSIAEANFKGRNAEYIYLRPTNGRADDQVRRNHSTQYSSHPDCDFARSRKEAPEKYESYVDLEPGVWTKYKIEVEGRTARLYVHGAAHPCLIVNDLKLEPRGGTVALWVGPGTEGHFSNLKITAK